MKKTIKLLDLDCGHCADKIQNAVKKIDGVTSVSVNFLGQKMVLEAPDDQFDAVLAEAKAAQDGIFSYPIWTEYCSYSGCNVPVGKQLSGRPGCSAAMLSKSQIKGWA